MVHSGEIKQPVENKPNFVMAFVSHFIWIDSDRKLVSYCWSVSDLPFSICTVNVINTRCRYFVFIFDL